MACRHAGSDATGVHQVEALLKHVSDSATNAATQQQRLQQQRQELQQQRQELPANKNGSGEALWLLAAFAIVLVTNFAAAWPGQHHMFSPA